MWKNKNQAFHRPMFLVSFWVAVPTWVLQVIHRNPQKYLGLSTKKEWPTALIG